MLTTQKPTDAIDCSLWRQEKQSHIQHTTFIAHTIGWMNGSSLCHTNTHTHTLSLFQTNITAHTVPIKRYVKVFPQQVIYNIMIWIISIIIPLIYSHMLCSINIMLIKHNISHKAFSFHDYNTYYGQLVNEIQSCSIKQRTLKL